MFLLWLLSGMVLSAVASSQTITIDSTSTETFSPQKLRERKRPGKIKWSWQLPHNIRKAFNQSMFCKLYIEKMVSYSADGKTFYVFYLNNSNLLDGDNFPCFFKKSRLTVADDGTVVDTATSDSNQQQL